MEYSKEAILKTKYGRINNINNTIKRTSKIRKKIKESTALKWVFYISIICSILIVADMILIFNFVKLLQTVL